MLAGFAVRARMLLVCRFFGLRHVDETVNTIHCYEGHRWLPVAVSELLVSHPDLDYGMPGHEDEAAYEQSES